MRHLAVALASAFSLLLAAVSLRAAEDLPATDRALPDWFKDVVLLVETASQRAKEQSEAKLAEARAAKDLKTEALATLGLAHVARRQNDIPGALRLSREAMALAETANDDLVRFNTVYGHALNLRAAGDQASTLEYLLRSLQFAQRYNSIRAQGVALSAIGATYNRLGDNQRGADYMRQALALAQQAKDEKAILMYSSNLANYAESIGDFATARQGYELYLEFKRKEGNRTLIADAEQDLAMLDFAEGKTEAALAALQPILAQRRTLRGKVKLTSTLCKIAQVLVKLGRFDEALAHLEEARPHVETIESRGLRATYYHELAATQEGRKDFAAALAAARKEFAEREAIAGETAQSRAAELQIQFDVAKKDQELTRLARANELQAAEARARTAQLAQTAAELRAKNFELQATTAELAQTRSTRLAVIAAVAALAAVLGAIVMVQRTRIRAERRILADTRAARDAAEQADALKGRLLGFASHDLKAPLSTLSASTHLIEASSSPDEIKKLAVAMRAETSRMVLLVHDFIDRAALDAGRLELRPESLDLGVVAVRVVADFQPRARQKGQVLTLEESPTALPVVSGEPVRLEQVLANLLSNAINYTPRQGIIRVQLGHDATGVWCEVSDNGPGIALEEQARLFQPFARLSARPTAGESSSGLGLYLAHELMRLHGGTLSVRSHPGAGAAFRMTLPVSPEIAG